MNEILNFIRVWIKLVGLFLFINIGRFVNLGFIIVKLDKLVILM